LFAAASRSGLADKSESQVLVAVCELILEGLHAQKKISRSEERGYVAAKPERRGQAYESFSRSRKIN
jgi:magnesium chelatase subunit I